MENRKYINEKDKKIAVVPLIFGTVSFLSAFGYFHMANNYRNISLPYRMIDVFGIIWFVASLTGVIVSIITRKYRKVNSTLWWSGTIICIVSVLIFAMLIVCLVASAIAFRNL